jgi:hypothetical protein
MLRHRHVVRALSDAFLYGVGFGAFDGLSAADLEFFYVWTLLDQLNRSRVTRPRAYPLARLWFSAVLREQLRSGE